MFRNINILNGKVQLNPILIGGMGMMKYMQRLGKSLMLPVSVMPIAALLKGIGYWIDPTGWGSNNAIAAFLIESGGAIIDNLQFYLL